MLIVSWSMIDWVWARWRFEELNENKTNAEERCKCFIMDTFFIESGFSVGNRKFIRTLKNCIF